MFGGGVDTIKTTLADVQTKVNAVEGSVNELGNMKVVARKANADNTVVLDVQGKGKLIGCGMKLETDISLGVIKVEIDGVLIFTFHRRSSWRGCGGYVSSQSILSYFDGGSIDDRALITSFGCITSALVEDARYLRFIEQQSKHYTPNEEDKHITYISTSPFVYNKSLKVTVVSNAKFNTVVAYTIE